MSSLEKLKQLRSLHVNSRRGFSLVIALISILILLALGYLVVMMSTQDIRASTRVVGEKKAMAAAETGVHQLMANFDPQSMSGWGSLAFTSGTTSDVTSAYTIALPTRPASGPVISPIPGYSVGRFLVFVADVTGTSSKYNATVNVQVGINSMDPTCLTEYELCR